MVSGLGFRACTESARSYGSPASGFEFRLIFSCASPFAVERDPRTLAPLGVHRSKILKSPDRSSECLSSQALYECGQCFCRVVSSLHHEYDCRCLHG